MHGTRLRGLVLISLLCLACHTALTPASLLAQEAPRLRPTTMFSQHLPGLRFDDAASLGLYPNDEQDGWAASVQQQLQAPRHYVFVLQKPGSRDRLYVLQHTTTTTHVLRLAADSRWIVWQQNVDTHSAADWQLIAHDTYTQREWLVDSERAEGSGGCEFNVGGDLLGLTLSNFKPGGSEVRAINLATHRMQILGFLKEQSPWRTYEWPATDGRYVAWSISQQDRNNGESNTIQLYDTVRRKLLPLHIRGNASEPVVGYGAIAWKAAPLALDGSALGAEDLRTGHQYFVRIPGSTSPSIGPCTVGFSVYGNTEGGIWDYCTGQSVILSEQQLRMPPNLFLGFNLLAGQYAYVRGIKAQNGVMMPGGPYMSVFHLSVRRPLFDFFH